MGSWIAYKSWECYRAIIYEPALGRFLTIDPHPGVMSDPVTSVNKYIYARNNPFKFVDPDGEFIFTTFLISAAIGGAVNVSFALITGKGSLGEAFLIGAVSGGVGYITGGLATSFFGSQLGGYIGASLAGGITSKIFGGSFFAGAVGGATGHLIGSSLGAIFEGFSSTPVGDATTNPYQNKVEGDGFFFENYDSKDALDELFNKNNGRLGVNNVPNNYIQVN